MNIDGWLRERGLEYQATFRDNAITEKVREALAHFADKVFGVFVATSLPESAPGLAYV
jgi:hypothetical protein